MFRISALVPHFLAHSEMYQLCSLLPVLILCWHSHFLLLFYFPFFFHLSLPFPLLACEYTTTALPCQSLLNIITVTIFNSNRNTLKICSHFEMVIYVILIVNCQHSKNINRNRLFRVALEIKRIYIMEDSDVLYKL